MTNIRLLFVGQSPPCLRQQSAVWRHSPRLLATSMTIGWLPLARGSKALLPRMGSSNRPSHSSTGRLLVMTKLEP